VARTGKIACLPRTIREELNQRLHDGQTGAQILPWLNEQAEQHLANHPRWGADTTINDNALSNWRNGGYVDWCKDLAKLDVIERKVDLAARIASISGGDIFSASGQVAAGDLLELFDAESGTVTGGPDDGAEVQGPDKIGLALAVAKLLDASAKKQAAGILQEKLHLDRDKAEREKDKALREKEKIAQSRSKLKLEWQKFASNFLNWYEDKRTREIADQAGSSRAQKIAALADLFGEMPDGIGPANL
jgi:hypothetical protein